MVSKLDDNLGETHDPDLLLLIVNVINNANKHSYVKQDLYLDINRLIIMKFEPWISINLLLICLSIGFLSLRIEPNTKTTLNAAEVSTYLKQISPWRDLLNNLSR